MTKDTPRTSFAPMLIISNGTHDISFYEKAFGAVELRRWSNDDGSVHVAEFSIDGVLFHLHEENPANGKFSPARHNGVTTTIGLMVPDVNAMMDRAKKAGARELSPAQDYDYGYRQGEIADPFGHCWIIQMVI